MRRRAAQPGASFSLFPFLAVLLCTMGSLIVLRLVVVRHGKVQAETLARQQQQSPAEALDAAGISEEEAQRRRQEQKRLADLAAELRTMRDDFRARLEHSRLDLSHLEDHIRRLQAQLAQMEADYQVLKQSQPQGAGAAGAKLAELMQLQRKLEMARGELQQARAQAASKPRSYAIVPYDGPHGTHRRPIYIECQKEQIILQPEGIVLMPGDFAGPLDAGNPLAAALRATREYLHGSGALHGGEPYPLLLVRPDGAQMYSAARAAMESWSSEYGYELIDADMQLAFPPADEALGDIVRRTVNLSRNRSIYAALRRQPIVGPGAGGGGPGGTSSGVGAGENSGGNGAAGSGDGGYGRGSGTGRGGAYLSASRDGGFQLHGANDPADDWLDRHVRGPRSPVAAAAGRPEQGTAAIHPEGTRGSPSGSRTIGPFYASEQPRAESGNAVGGSRRTTGTAQAASNTDSADAGSLASSAADEAGASAGAAGAMSNPHQNSQANSPGLAGNALAPSEIRPDQAAPVGLNFTKDFTPPPPLAQTRGTDWALPGSARGATPFTRPIRVACHADKLVVLPDRGSTERQRVIPLEGPLAGSVDRFVAELWQHVNHWGTAGPRAYWKPILSVEVANGGDARYAELAALMDQSGVEVQRKVAE